MDCTHTRDVYEDLSQSDHDQREKNPVDTDVKLITFSCRRIEHAHLVTTGVGAKRFEEEQNENTEEGEGGSHSKSLQDGSVAVSQQWHH